RNTVDSDMTRLLPPRALWHGDKEPLGIAGDYYRSSISPCIDNRSLSSRCTMSLPHSQFRHQTRCLRDFNGLTLVGALSRILEDSTFIISTAKEEKNTFNRVFSKKHIIVI
ncbi:1061_t:CDS:2, partial [Acaulospora morrowiae]